MDLDVGAPQMRLGVPAPGPGHHRSIANLLVSVLPVLVFLTLALTSALATPAWENNDESSHVQYIEYLMRHHDFPPISLENGIESHQPPLYYGLAAVWQKALGIPNFTPSIQPRTAAERTRYGDLREVSHDYVGQQRSDAKTVHLLRLLSVLCGALTVLAAQMAGRLLFIGPARRPLSLAIALVVACWPKFIVVSSSVTNDVLADAFSAWLFVGALVFIGRGLSPRARRWVGLWVGLAAAGAALSKFTSLPVIVLVAAALAVFGIRRRGGLIPGLIAVGAFAAASGWWFLRNQIKYGDPLASAATERYLSTAFNGRLVQHLSLTDVGALYHQRINPFLIRSTWYDGGWNQLTLPSAMNLAIWSLAALSLLVSAITVLRFRNDIGSRWLVVACVSIGSIGAWLSIARETTQGEGRYLFVGIVAWAALLTAGAFQARGRVAIWLTSMVWPVLFFSVDCYVLAKNVIPNRGL